MVEAIFIPISFFIAVFGIVYLHFSTRNKERLALIEKGADASIFASGSKSSWKVLTLNTALLLIGIGLAIFIGAVLENMGLDEDVAYPGSIFIMAGIGLLVGFFLNKKMEKER
jgi:hypothetical protein